MKILCVLFGISLLGVSACADAIPAVRNAAPQTEVLVQIVGEGAQINDAIYWPYWLNGVRVVSPQDGMIAAGTRHIVLARLPGDEWLRVEGGWIATASTRLVVGALEQVPLVLTRGLWLLSPGSQDAPLRVTSYARWNSWQWDPEGSGLWYGHFEASPAHSGYAPVSRLILDGSSIRRDHSRLYGYAEVLAAPVGSAVLVRAGDRSTWPLGDVYILEADGTVYHLGRQCDVYYTDAYVPFGTDAAWSPDGRYVILRDGRVSEGGSCIREGTTIYDRNGVVEPDLTDRHDPYRQAWYREPNFTDQISVDEQCMDTPPGAAMNDRRNRCIWSPDRQWFATMPGSVDNPHLADLLIYTADGTLVERFLIIGWGCNSFQWSPDSQWLAYGGPSGCA